MTNDRSAAPSRPAPADPGPQRPHEQIFQTTLRVFLEPVVAYLDDPDVTEILINGPDQVFVEHKGRLTRADARFEDEDALLATAKNIAQYVGKRLTPEASRVDARLPDGSRVHLVSGSLCRLGTIIAIRKFSRETLTVAKLVGFGAFTEEMLEFLRISVLARKNVLVSGGTSSGKTSLLNALSALIPHDERILVLEDSSELQLQQEHVVPFEVRAPDRHGEGGVSIRDLFHSALRLRPDRIVIGEIRSGEALDLIQAMTSGHSGCMSTLHANTPDDSLNRLETMALMANLEIPQKALRTQISQAVDLIVQVSRFRDGTRRVTHISEACHLGPDGNYRTQPIYVFQTEGVDSRGKVLGRHAWTRVRPTWAVEAHEKGYGSEIDLTSAVFGPAPVHDSTRPDSSGRLPGAGGS